MNEHKKSTSFLAQAALAAALYVLLTWLTSLAGLAGGQIQVRLSEALCVLPVFTPAAIPGLFAGCLLANLVTGAALPDIILGSLTTLAAAFLTYKLRHNKYLAVMPPVILNTIVVPLMLYYVYGFVPLWLSFITVFAGELISAGVLGILLHNVLSKYRTQIFTHQP